MKFQRTAACVLAVAIAAAPLCASAHGHHGDFGLFAVGAAIIGVTAAVVSAPFIALDHVASQPYYAAPPAYYSAPPSYAPPVAYQQPPAYYAQQAPGYYPPPPPPGYYPRPQVYYAPQYYSYR